MTVTSQNVYYINPVADKNRRTLSCHYLNIYFGCSQLGICFGSVKDNPVVCLWLYVSCVCVCICVYDDDLSAIEEQYFPLCGSLWQIAFPSISF